MGSFLDTLFGPLLRLVNFLAGCFPHMLLVHANQLGVRYPAGGEPVELRPDKRTFPILLRRLFRTLGLQRLAALQGVHVYFPVIEKCARHYSCRQVIGIDPIVLETHDGNAVAAGLVLTYRIQDVLAFEVRYFDAEDSLAELAEGALRRMIQGTTSSGINGGGEELDRRLASECTAALSEVGIKVESARLTELVHLTSVQKVFGLSIDASTQVG